MRWIALRWQPESLAACVGGEASPLKSGVTPNAGQGKPPDQPLATDAEEEASCGSPTPEALGWWALQFTPHVVWLENDILLLEVSACARMWGGMKKLGQHLSQRNPSLAQLMIAQAATSLVAMARLRLRERGDAPPTRLPDDLPLQTLSAAAPHLEILARMGCRSWGDVAALPRAGLARRFGPELREALDIAWGLRPELHRWLTLPDVFDQKLELPALAHGASELMWSANRLFSALQLWLRARHHGVLAVQLQWTLDLRRVDGIDLPPHEQLVLRTAEPTQDMAHLRRLTAERLDRTRMAAPASWLRLTTLQTAAWAGASTSFLPEDSRKGDPLHHLIERLSERLGAAQVLMPVTQAGHAGPVPETMQRWQPARGRLQMPARSTTAKAVVRAPTSLPASDEKESFDPEFPKEISEIAEQKQGVIPPASASGLPMPATFPRRSSRKKPSSVAAIQPDALYPAWLLDPAEPLEVRNAIPCWQGDALHLLAGPQRLDSHWWAQREVPDAQPVMRDYFIAQRPAGDLVWIYRERAAARGQTCWFLQGLYA
jgi:protein ImuB